MKTWFDSDLQLRRQMIANIAQEKNIESATIEKDWWVTMTLKALFLASCHEFISFKGGTSLSKGWNLIDRFSEAPPKASARNCARHPVCSSSMS